MPNSPTPNQSPDQLDSAWKCAIDFLIEEFLATCFPAILAILDLSRPITAVDTELHQPADGISPMAMAVHADRVFLCHAKDGRPTCLHIEIQCQREEHFAERMFVYHALLFAKHRLPVISLAILGDGSENWRPAQFAYDFGGTGLSLRFGIAKLLDLEPSLPTLLESGNSFALFAAAHLEIMRTKAEPFARMRAKCRLTEILCLHGKSNEQVALMFELLDRLMQLPAEQDRSYRQFVWTFKEKHMLTITQRLKHDAIRRGLERGTSLGLRWGFRTGREAGEIQGRQHGLQQGLEQGRQQGRDEGRDEGRRMLLVELVEQRFGPLTQQDVARLDQASPDEVARWTRRFCEAETLQDLLG